MGRRVYRIIWVRDDSQKAHNALVDVLCSNDFPSNDRSFDKVKCTFKITTYNIHIYICIYIYVYIYTYIYVYIHMCIYSSTHLVDFEEVRERRHGLCLEVVNRKSLDSLC